MRFDLLGPFNVVHDGRPVVLRGATQRAVLAYLLLRHNEVIATSTLLQAIWADDIPATARKMVQNAVSGLRATLAQRTGAAEQAMLLTHAPGYLLRVDSDQVDVSRFRRLATEGRTAQAGGEVDRAVSAYRDALALWRGPVLADLTETGVVWPELVALEDQRIAVHEDLFGLELDRGHHHEVLTDLRGMAEANPNRERLNAQLMTALYRCGRHVDALEVYRATRASLAEGLGLEPGKELRELERAILQHDEALLTRRPEPAPRPEPVPSAEPTPVVEPLPFAPAPVIALPRTEPVESERKPVVAIGVALAATPDDDPEEAVEVQARLRTVVEEEALAAGAHLPGESGPVVLALFGLPRTDDDDAVHATRTALRIHDRLATAGIATQIGVDSGDVLVEFTTAGPGQVAGPVLDRCVRSALRAPEGRIRVSDVVREASEPSVVHEASEDSPGWWHAVSARQHPVAEPADPGGFVGREHDLDLLSHLLGFVERGGRPHRVTVLGEPGIGKSRLLAEFAETLSEQPRIRVLDAGADVAEAFAVVPGLLPQTASRLRTEGGDSALRAAAGELTAFGPLVVLADDLHRADLDTRDAVDRLGEACSGLPVLIVASARPGLLEAEHGERCGTTVSLAPLSDDAVGKLLDKLLPGTARLIRGRQELIGRIGGNPRFAHAYAQGVHGKTTPFPGLGQAMTPPLVRRTLAAQLDNLPAAEKSLLKAASLTGDAFTAEDVAAVCGRDSAEIEGTLSRLASLSVLRREDDDAGYTFRRSTLRELVYQRIPRATRTALLRRPTAPRRVEALA
ncbi:BTAD domain-containing putative transcriptional regulator [Amycolatopsis thailandensis]|uniref:BTAD domain-containing putative transcriptional regulator n=1 Tax=Amycolatopsis thailandensis TaxID=589330 RepID=UPI00365464C1